ncbi:MAG TPA: hypothetical protein VKT52_05680 [Ktedonobacterales bacterium]|nr:hypothetical protein [Ktedonobacterales bacterium]
MATEQIILRVSEEAARAFRQATPEEHLRLETLVSLHLIGKLQPPRTLDGVIAEMSQRAQERGLTPELLEDLLRNAYPTVASLAGAAGSLQRPMPWDKMRDIAREDRHLESKTKQP